MLCRNCKIDRLITDFINNQKFCYHCMYRIKLEKDGLRRVRPHLFCRICGKEIVIKENLKKRQRSVFCSNECAVQGHKKQLNNHWTRMIRRDNSLKW
jgi:predicted nucleic acid-binding Zn ribbon protein